VEPVHECRKALVSFADAGRSSKQAEIDPGVQPKQESLYAGLPVLGKKVAQGFAAFE
jgi:hypothetical protein